MVFALFEWNMHNKPVNNDSSIQGPTEIDYVSGNNDISVRQKSIFKEKNLQKESCKNMSFVSGSKKKVSKSEKNEKLIDNSNLQDTNLDTSLTSNPCTTETKYALFFNKELNSEQRQKILEEIFSEDDIISDEQLNDILTSNACTTEAKYALFFSKKVNETQKQNVLKELFLEDDIIPDEQLNTILKSSACTTEVKRVLFFSEKVNNQQKSIILTNNPEIIDKRFEKYKKLKDEIDKNIWKGIVSIIQHVELLKFAAWIIDNEDPVLFALIARRIDTIILTRQNIYKKPDLNYFIKQANEILETYKENKQKIKDLYERPDDFLKLINEDCNFNADTQLAEFLRPNLFEKKISEEIIEKLNERFKQENNIENRMKLNIMLEAFINRSDVSMRDVQLEQNKRLQTQER